MDLVRCEAIFFGRVQGVGFRATARHLAAEYKVVGWVRNEADGSVRLVVEGPQDTLTLFLDELRHRLGDYINKESAATGESTGRYTGFEVR